MEEVNSPIDMQLNYPVLPGQDEQLAEQLRRVAAKPADLLVHQPPGGLREHREAAAEWMATSPERVLLCAGGHHAVLTVLLTAGLAGKKIAVDPLTYAGIKAQAAVLDIELVPCDGDEQGMLPGALERAAEDRRVSAVFLMPTVHNPLGYVMPEERRREICEVCQRYGLLIIDDDAYRFCEAGAPPTFAALAPQSAFSIFSFTKPVAPAVKVAYLVLPPAYAEQAMETISASSGGVSAVLAEIAAAMVRDGSLATLIAAKRREAARRQSIARNILCGAAMRGHPASFHLWIDLPDAIRADEVTEQLEFAGVLVSAASGMAAAPDVQANGIRVALGAEQDFARVEQGLRAVADCIASLQ